MEIPRRTALEASLYRLSKRWHRFSGSLPEGIRTPHAVGGRPVYLVHNPKCAGSSLKRLLGVNASRTTHTWPRDLFQATTWENGLIICAIRHPFERFLSSWRYHCRSDYRGKLVKRHGPLLHLSPLDYFHFIKQYPENLGLQSLWVDYPSTVKPKCDIILRSEESASWPGILREAGIVVSDSSVPQLNTTSDFHNHNVVEAGCANVSFERLREIIHRYYESDYLRFGYTP